MKYNPILNIVNEHGQVVAMRRLPIEFSIDGLTDSLIDELTEVIKLNIKNEIKTELIRSIIHQLEYNNV